MATLNIPTADTAVVEEVITPVVVPQPPVVVAPVQRIVRPSMYYMPSYWDIQANEAGDGIIAKSLVVANETFTGTMADFNALLRGE
jgi:hypothetical protein